MKRRGLLQAGAALGVAGLPLGAAWAQAAAVPAAASGAASAALPAVLGRPALQSPLALRGALLAATRAGQRLLVAGERGTVAYSDDDGKTWAQARVPARVSITALQFDNEREGWAAGHFGALLRTSDGGQTWRLVMDGARAAQVLLREAQDEGTRRAAQRKLEEGPDKPFFDLAHAGGKLLAVGAFGLALESADGGTSFQSLAARLPNPRQLHLYGMAADGPRVFAVGEQGLLVRSADGGASFTAVPTPYKGSFFGVLLLPDGVVLSYGLRGNVWRSPDDGNTWAQVANPVPVSISAGTLLADGGVVLVAQNGDLLISRDQGQSFQRRPAAPPFPAADVVAAGNGQLVLTGLRGWMLVPLG